MIHGAEYRVRATHDEHGVGSDTLSIDPPVPVDERTVVLRRGVPCAGRVLFREPPREGEQDPILLLVEGPDGSPRQVRLDLEAGTAPFRVTGLDPGSYEASILVLRRRGEQLYGTLAFELPEGGDARLLLEFVGESAKRLQGGR